MSKGINYACAELKENIVKLLNDSKLPIVNIRYVLTELMQEVVIQERTVIEQEKEEYEKQRNAQTSSDTAKESELS